MECTILRSAIPPSQCLVVDETCTSQKLFLVPKFPRFRSSLFSGSDLVAPRPDAEFLKQRSRVLLVDKEAPVAERERQDDEKNEFYVNVGRAIRLLREEMPCLFYQDLTYDIYREDITFRDTLNTFRGLSNYKLLFWSLRFHGAIFFRALAVDVLRVWQPSSHVIMVRWSVRGMPRVPWETQGHFDGTSEYRLDSRGKIYEHKVSNVIMNDQMSHSFQPLTVMELLRLSGAKTVPSVTCPSCSSSSSASGSSSTWALLSGAAATTIKDDREGADQQQCSGEEGSLVQYLWSFSFVRLYHAMTRTVCIVRSNTAGPGPAT